MQQVCQVAKECCRDLAIAVGQPVELAALGKSGESWPQAAGGIATEIPFAAEAGPMAEDNQGNHLAAGQGSLGAGSGAGRGLGFAKVISRDAECREEGVRIRQDLASFLTG